MRDFTNTCNEDILCKAFFESILKKIHEARELIIYDEDTVWNRALRKCEEIVQEVAEEYVPDTNVGNNSLISCSERLPDENHENNKIIEWKPLPELYQRCANLVEKLR